MPTLQVPPVLLESASGKHLQAYQALGATWDPVLEFENEEAFRSWYYSPAYQEAVKLRLAATDSRAALVKGRV